MNSKQSKRKGYVSIEFVFGLTVFLITMVMVLGMFFYSYPRQKLEKEVAILAQQAKVNGGLTQENISEFGDRLDAMGLTGVVYAYTAERTVLNVAPRNTPYASCVADYNAFITRASGDVIYIEVVVNANVSMLSGPLKFFAAKTFPENYTLVDTVLSERNGC